MTGDSVALTSAGIPRDRPEIRAYVGAVCPKIVFVGEAFGEREKHYSQPFVGASGKEFWRMLGEALPAEDPQEHMRVSAMHRYGDAWIGHRLNWMNAAGIGFTNVFNLRPPDNKIEHFLGTKSELNNAVGGLPPLGRGLYLRQEYFGELDRLESELLALNPNIVVTLGATALWALGGGTGIGAVRGTIRAGELGRWKGKVLPTYHPAAVLRQWSWRTITVADIAKAWRQAGYPEIRRPRRRVLVSPSMAEITAWVEGLERSPPSRLAVDVETAIKQITCIGFAPSRSEAAVIPFFDPHKGRGYASYWATHSEEMKAWSLVERLLNLPCEKVFQNGMYDLQYILPLGFQPRGLGPDTMLKHHSLFPEMQKGLGFLGSVYTEEPAWKLMRRKRPDTEKRDE